MKNLAIFSFLTIIFCQTSYAAVNINTASIEELQQVKGIGYKKAQKIVIYRNVHGKFHNIHELNQVKGFNDTSIHKIAQQIEAK